MSGAFTNYHFFVPHPPQTWQQCQVGECEEQTRWICYPHGYLTNPIALCDGHKIEAERQQDEEEKRA